MNVAGTLAAQHELLEEVIDRLGEHLTRGDLLRVKLGVEELRQAFKAHLDLEDAELYPSLLAPVEAGGEAAAALARNFQETIQPLWQSFTGFAQRQAAQELPEADAFAAEWGPLSQALRARLAAEENALLPLYRRVAGKSGLLRSLHGRPGTRVA